MEFDLIKFLNWLQERWYSKHTIVVLILVFSFLLLGTFSGIDITKINKLEWIIFFIIILFTFIFWFLSTRLPKNSKGKVGFIVSIYTENKEQYKKLKSDFIDSLREYINQGNFRHQFKFILYPNYYSKKIDNQEIAIKLLQKSHAHFMIYGRSRERQIKGKTHFVLNMEGVVTHKPIPSEISKSFSKEFAELFPRRLLIQEEDDLFAFDLFSNLVNIVSKYIVGIASYISGDLIYAKDLFFSLQNEISSLKTDLIFISKIKQRLPNRLVEVLFNLSLQEYLTYRKTKDISNLNQMGEYLNEIEKYTTSHYPSNLLKSIYLFLSKRDIKSAISTLKRNKDLRDGLWRFNYAFLKAYEGDLDASHRAYKNAFKYSYPDITPMQIEEFIIDILEEEPDNNQLYYCLGLINFYAKRDFASAKRDFQLFLDKTIEEEYVKQRKLAQNFILSIDSKLT